MAPGTREIMAVCPRGMRPPWPLADLVERARQSGEPLRPLWEERVAPTVRAACAHGERHALWWEFALVRSLEAQQQAWDLAPSLFRWRLRHLAAELRLGPVLHCRVLDLTPAERARADLAAALLTRPEALLWEEPFAAMPPEDRTLAARLVRSLVRSEGLVVVAAASEPPGLADLGTTVRSLKEAPRSAGRLPLKEAATL